MKKILISIIISTAFCSVCFPCGPIPPPTAVLWVNGDEITIADHNAYVIKDKSFLLDGSLSTPGSGSIIRCQWDFNGDNKYDYAESGAVHPDGTFDGRTWHKFENTGKYTVKLMVTDSAGYSGTITADVNVSNDSDTDGLPDAWEIRYFGNLSKDGSANSDNDSNGYTDLCEYLHGSDPNNAGNKPSAGIIVAHGSATPIQKAINGSISGDTIIVLPGTYDENINFSVANRKLCSIDPNNWEIVGNTIIKAGNEAAYATVEIYDEGATISNTTVLEGFTITGARGDYARGIACVSSDFDVSPVISKCIIKENGIWPAGQEYPSHNGGGIRLYESSAIIKNCFIIHNTCYASSSFDGRGGGISIYGGGSPQISNCVFYENGAYCGGALSLYGGGSLTMRNCTIVGNSTYYGYGGGLFNDSGTINIYNTVLWGNRAYYSGDQIYNLGGTINDVNCWIQGVQQNDPCFADITLPAGKDGIYGTRDDGLRLRASGTSTWTGSPCVDDGNGTGAPSADIIGQARVDIPNKSGGSGNPSYVDIGAYELNRIWFVKTTGSGNGQSWQTPSSLQIALFHASYASAGSEIWAAQGTYNPTTGSDRTISFNLPSNVSVYGGFTGEETALADRNYSTNKTILSGDIGTQNVAADNSYHVVTAIDKTGVLLDGFTVQDGYYSGGSGGGIYAASASMSVRNCVIAGNYAGYGGGIGNGDGDFWLPSSIQIANCVLANNTASTGGAMHSNSYSLLAEIVNCTIAGNSAASNGGGIANGGPLIIENSIIWDNNVGANPSNVYNYNNAAPMISYSDIQGCGGSPPGGTWNTAFGNDCGKNIALDPQFVDSEDFNGVDDVLGTADDGLRLNGESPNISPCIDEGNNSFIHEGYDIAGNKRIRRGIVDMGAYERPFKPLKPLYAGGSENSADTGAGVVVYEWRPTDTSWHAISDEGDFGAADAVLCLCYHGTAGNKTIYAGTMASVCNEAAVYRWDSGTTNWTKVSNDNWGADEIDAVLSLIEYQGSLYAGTKPANLYRYDGENNWKQIDSNLSDWEWNGIKCLYEWDGILYLGDSYYDFIARYAPPTISAWTSTYRPDDWDETSCILDFELYHNRLYASAIYWRIHRSDVNDGNAGHWSLRHDWWRGGWEGAWELEEYEDKLFISCEYKLYEPNEEEEPPNPNPIIPIWEIPSENRLNDEEIISMLSTGDYLYIGTGGEFSAGGNHSPGQTGNVFVYDGTGDPQPISDGLEIEGRKPSGINCLLEVP